MTEDERQARRERDRQYSADYRARKRVEAASRARAAADGSDGSMRQSVDAAVLAMKWLKDSDVAAVAQVKAVATLVDAATLTGEHARALRAHGQLTRLLDVLGGTPQVRMKLELRSGKLAVAESDAAPGVAKNVSRFERPAKRPR